MVAEVGAAVLMAVDTVPGAIVDRWLAAMPAAARQRALGFRSGRRYRQFVVARRLLATLLGERFGYLPAIVGEPGAKPGVEGSDIHCSIAHSGDAVMAAFSVLAPVGADIEQCRPRQFERLVTTYFHPREQMAFAALDATAREQWFYRAWTRKEACAKAAGQGLTLQMLASHTEESGDNLALSNGCFQGYAVAVAHRCSVRVTPRLASYADGEIAHRRGAVVSAVGD